MNAFVFSPIKVTSVQITADGLPVRSLTHVLTAFRSGSTLKGRIHFPGSRPEHFTAHLSGIVSGNGHGPYHWVARLMGYDNLEAPLFDYLTGNMGF